jgi:hypothetical protein
VNKELQQSAAGISVFQSSRLGAAVAAAHVVRWGVRLQPTGVRAREETAMGLFSWLFRKPTGPEQAGRKRYEYATGNVELAERVERGEFLMAVMADITPRWTPGNEHLWDEYDPESLLDTPQKRQHLVNALLFGRLAVYRALRAAGRDIRGHDPFEFEDQVPEVMARFRERFPGVFEEGASPAVRVEARPLTLSPYDPGLEAPDTPG